MGSFFLHLGGKNLAWFVGLDKGTISSYGKLVEMFCNKWDSRRHNEWIPHVKHAKDLLNKEAQKKDQVEATIVQGLIDDILSTIDEAPQAGEYDDGPIYEDPEVLVEGVEEQKDRMSSFFQHAETPYDLSDLWEHNHGNSEDDGYWTFMVLLSMIPRDQVALSLYVAARKNNLMKSFRLTQNLTLFGMKSFQSP